MSHFARIRRHPLFAPLFAAVHPFFWPLLYWQLGRMIGRMKENNLSGVLFGVTWWGQLHILFPGDKNPDPDAYTPHTPQRPRWDDPVWASAVPAVFEIQAVLAGMCAALLLLRAAGGGGISLREMTEGAPPSQLFNTS